MWEVLFSCFEILRKDFKKIKRELNYISTIVYLQIYHIYILSETQMLRNDYFHGVFYILSETRMLRNDYFHGFFLRQ